MRRRIPDGWNYPACDEPERTQPQRAALAPVQHHHPRAG